MFHHNLQIFWLTEHTSRLKFVKLGLKLVELVPRVLRDMPFVLGRLNRSDIHKSFNWNGGSIITRDREIKGQLELL